MQITILVIATLIAFVGCKTTSSFVPPKILEQGEIIYPHALLESAPRGEALIEFDINEDGTVSNAFVVSATHELFGQAALKSIENSRFSPPMENGKPRSVHTRVPVYIFPPKSTNNG